MLLLTAVLYINFNNLFELQNRNQHLEQGFGQVTTIVWSKGECCSVLCFDINFVRGW